MVADGFCVRPNTISGILAQLRREGLEKKEQRLLEEVIKSLTEGDEERDSSRETESEALEPNVMVLNRQRRG